MTTLDLESIQLTKKAIIMQSSQRVAAMDLNCLDSTSS